MDNTTKKVFQFLTKIVRWSVIIAGNDFDNESRKRIANICKGDFSDFEEDSDG